MSSLPFKDALRVWIKVALYSFGGPAGQIAVMHKFIVEEKKWISEERFLHALNYCMLLPGPEAQQLSVYIGWLLHKTKGGLVAGLLFVLPGFLSILLLSIVYALLKETVFVEAIFYGVKPAIMAIVVAAMIKIGKKTLKNEYMVAIAIFSFLAIFVFGVPFPLIIITAGIAGLAGGKLMPSKFLVIKTHEASGSDKGKYLIDGLPSAMPSTLATLWTILFWLLLWVLPIAFIYLVIGSDNIFMAEGLFFSKAAVITFGGAYSVLAYIAQQAVETYNWLLPGEMMDGLGMAETTPGPLIQVVQFVGFMGAYRMPGTLDPLMAGFLASVLVTWVTFVPCFLFIFAGAPYIEYLRGKKFLTAALSAITSAVSGVILNLALWFSIHTIFNNTTQLTRGGLDMTYPVWSSVDWGSLVIAVGAFVLMFRFRLNMFKLLGASVVAGLLWYFLVL